MSLQNGLSLSELLIAIFLFLTAPISAHIMAKAALHTELKMFHKTRDFRKEGDAYEHEKTDSWESVFSSSRLLLEVITKVDIKAVINLTTIGCNVTTYEGLVFRSNKVNIGIKTTTCCYRDT